jgi:phage baseplate assembly protein W
VDLHLDLKLTQNVGLGLSPVNTRDIEVDYDKIAISNSIYNLFSARQGFKVLTPEFAGSLDKYLFEPVSPEIASFIGNEMLTNINKFEPRIRVVKLYIKPVPDEGMYTILLNFEIIQSGLLYDLELKFNAHRSLTYNTI